MAYGVAGFYLLQRHFTPPSTWVDALESTVLLMAQAGQPKPDAAAGHRDAFWFCDSLVATGIVSAVYIALVLLRPLPDVLHSAGATGKRSAS